MLDEVGKMNLLHIIIEQNENLKKPYRADKCLSELDILPSRSQLKSWFEEGRIRRNGKDLSAKDILSVGDEIEIEVPPLKTYALEPREMPLEIFFEDEDLLVMRKDRGISMHPGNSYSQESTLVHGLMAHSDKLSSINGEFRPGIVHRLDKDTEGLIVIAKNNWTHEKLSLQFSERSIERNYWTLCWGEFPFEQTVEAPIGRHPKDRKKMAVVANGKPAKTYFRRLRQLPEGFSWLECKLFSGRTHQIRVHLSSIQHPILNDPVYGRPRKLHATEKKLFALSELKGQALVAFRLGFIHPRKNEKMLFELEPPKWLKILTET